MPHRPESKRGSLMTDRKRALIIDPSSIFRRTLKTVILTSEPHVAVTEAPNADLALEILRQQSPDVVFLDIALPQSNGIEFIRRIKKITPDTRIVVLTSHDSTEQKEASFKQGAEVFLSKESTVGLRLIDVIHSTLQLHGAT
jgi:DNA-binding NarL/FixJ family response regulator